MAKEKDKKKFSLYVKSLIIFAIVLLLLGGMFLSYVYRSLVTYEDNLIENIMGTMLKDGTLAEKYDGNFEISSYENNKDIKIQKLFHFLSYNLVFEAIYFYPHKYFYFHVLFLQSLLYHLF